MEKTKSTEVKLYLASANLQIKVDKSLKVGRSTGDVIIEDDEELSGLHCELIPRIMSLWIVDMGSHNGVYVNKVKILPHAEFKLEPGDEVLFGSQRFTFFDHEEALLAKFPKPDRRKSPRPKHLIAPANILNFHSASLGWKLLYSAAFLLTFLSLFRNAHLSYPLPDELGFLSRLYHEQIIASGLKAIFLVWAISVTHSFFLANYFNRTITRKVLAFGLYAGLIFFTFDFKNGPLSPIKTYVESRDAIMKEDFGVKSIIRLKRIVELEAGLKSSFPLITPVLELEQKKILGKDFEKLSRKIETHLKRDVAGK